MPTSRTRSLTTAALIAALLAASAYFAIPLQPVPVTFQTFVVVLAALLLEPVPAAAAVGTYLLLGAAGLPVFAGVRGGFGVLLGPTGGYLFGFLAGVAAGSFARRGLRWLSAMEADAISAAVTIGVVYAIGWLQLGTVLNLSPSASLVAGVLPFLPLDVAKAAAAVAVAAALRRSGVGGWEAQGSRATAE